MSRLISLRELEEGVVIKEVIKVLEAGLVVAIPTETYYGLAADPFNPQALKRLFALKRRPPEKPVLLLLGSLEQLDLLATSIPPWAEELISRFWPGPLTLVFQARKDLLPWLTGDTGKVALRLTSHPLARKIALAFGPVTGTSANLSGQPPARSAQEVAESLAPDLIVDAGPTEGGAPSTIVDVTVFPPKILRPGKVSREELKAALGEEDPQ